MLQVSPGDRLELILQVRAYPPPIYIWHRNTINLPFATDAELVIPRIGARDAGQYTCTITNELGSILAGPYTVNLVRKSSHPELLGGEGSAIIAVHVFVGVTLDS